eukprot:2709086-Rhodomonas_salina.1
MLPASRGNPPASSSFILPQTAQLAIEQERAEAFMALAQSIHRAPTKLPPKLDYYGNKWLDPFRVGVGSNSQVVYYGGGGKPLNN